MRVSSATCVVAFLVIVVGGGGCSKCSRGRGGDSAGRDASATADDEASASSSAAKPSEPFRSSTTWTPATEPPPLALSLDVRGDFFKAVAYSPDGRLLVTGSSDAFVWDRVTWNRLAILPGGTNHIDAVAFSPNNERIALIGEGLRIYDLASAKMIASYEPENGNLVKTIAWKADSSAVDFVSGNGIIGTLAATAGVGGALSKSVKPAITPLDFGNAVFTKDHQRVVLADRMTDKIYVVDAATGAILKRFAPSPSEVMLTFELDPTGKKLLVAYNGENAFRIFDVASGAQISKTAVANEVRIEAAAWSPDGATIATAGFNGWVKLFDARSLAEIGTVGPHSRSVENIVWSADSKQLVVLAIAPVIYDVASAASPVLLRRVPSFRVNTFNLSCSADGKVAATYDPDHGIFLFHPETGETTTFPNQNITRDGDGATAVGTDASRVSTVTRKGAVTHWDIATRSRSGGGGGTPIALADYLVTDGTSGQRVVFSPDNRHIAVLSAARDAKADPPLLVWSTDSGAVEARVRAVGDSFAWSPKGDLIAIPSEAGKIVVVDSKTGGLKADIDLKLPPFSDPMGMGFVRRVPAVFTADGEHIMTMTNGDAGGGMDVWRISKPDAKESNIAKLPTLLPGALAMPGGKYVISAGSIYDLKSGERVMWLKANAHACSEPKGKWVVSSTSTGLLFMRPADKSWLTIDVIPNGSGWATVAIASDQTFDAPDAVLPALHFKTHHDNEAAEKTASDLAARRKVGLAKAWLTR